MEVVFNIWFLVDIESGMSKYLYLRPYKLAGTDDEKFVILSDLAEYDYKMTSCIDYPLDCMNQGIAANYFINGEMEHHKIDSFIDSHLQYLIDKLNKKIALDSEAEKPDVLGTNAPLFVCTLLMKNEKGEIRPYTNDINKKWCFDEKSRLCKV